MREFKPVWKCHHKLNVMMPRFCWKSNTQKWWVQFDRTTSKHIMEGHRCYSHSSQILQTLNLCYLRKWLFSPFQLCIWNALICLSTEYSVGKKSWLVATYHKCEPDLGRELKSNKLIDSLKFSWPMKPKISISSWHPFFSDSCLV